MAAGLTRRDIYGYTHERVVEQPRSGFIAWVRNATPYVEDAGTVTTIETEEVPGMTLAELERIAIYRMTHGGLL